MTRSPGAGEGVWLWFAGVQYDGVAGTDRHLVDEVARRRPVVWVDPPVSWSDPRRVQVRARPVSDVDGVVRVRTVGPPGISRPLLREVARLLTLRQARRALRRSGRQVEVTVVSNPEHVLPRGRWAGTRLYYETDDFVAGARLLGHSVRHLARNRRRNVRRADGVLGVTEEVLAATRAGDKGHLLPNGCNPRVFHPAGSGPGVELRVPRPIAGVVGQLNERLDLRLLEAVADIGVSLLLLGPRYEQDPATSERLDRLTARANVQWIDRVPYADVPAVLGQLTVGLTPYTASAFNRGSFPLKTLEYLSAGLPVVSSDLPSARRLGSPDVRLAGTPEEFLHATRLLLAGECTAEDVDRRRRFAAQHSWEARARRLLEIATTARGRPLASGQGVAEAGPVGGARRRRHVDP